MKIVMNFSFRSRRSRFSAAVSFRFGLTTFKKLKNSVSLTFHFAEDSKNNPPHTELNWQGIDHDASLISEAVQTAGGS